MGLNARVGQGSSTPTSKCSRSPHQEPFCWLVRTLGTFFVLFGWLDAVFLCQCLSDYLIKAINVHKVRTRNCERLCRRCGLREDLPIIGADFGKTCRQQVRTLGTYSVVRTSRTFVSLQQILALKGCFCASNHVKNWFIRLDNKNLVKKIPIFVGLFFQSANSSLQLSFANFKSSKI